MQTLTLLAALLIIAVYVTNAICLTGKE